MAGRKTSERGPAETPSFQLAVRLLRGGRVGQADAMCRALLERNERDVNARRMRGTIALDRGMHDDAVAHFRKALEFEPESPVLLHSIGVIRKIQGRYDEAIEAFDEAMAVDPAHQPSIVGKAEVLERRGEHAAARALLEPIVESGTEDPEATFIFALLEHQAGRYEESAAVLRRQLAKPALHDVHRSKLLFGLGRTLEKLGDYDGSMAAFARANAIDAPLFDMDAERRKFDRRIQVFARERFAGLPRSNSDSDHLVFIVGMPRCGSTLVDQIIAAHPRAYSAGESDEMARLVQDLPKTLDSELRYPEIVDELRPENVDRLGRRHVERMRALDPAADRIVDKHLGNFAWLGLIAMLLPKSRVIHCLRDPVATCFSCYIHPLPPAPHPWSRSLRSLGLYYREYERLMRHWNEVLDEPPLEVRYEDLVADQERESRRIIEFCGLDWDDACLRFHETKRDVATISYDQVRRKIYDSSVRRYAPYESHLGELREALDT